MRRGLFGTVQGTIQSIVQPPSDYRPISILPSFKELERRLLGTKIESVDRLGKRVVIQNSNDDLLVFQPKMAGLLVSDTPPNEKHVRLVLKIANAPSEKIIYWDQRGLGNVKLFSRTEMEEFLRAGSIGPDALSIEFEQFYLAFRDCKRPVKPTLLDQSKVAGVGNLYASEIVHACRISPLKNCNELGRKAWRKIYDSMRSILTIAIEHEGSTLSDGTYRNSKNNPGSYQNSHKVYDRAGELCFTCGKNLIERIVQSQRSTFYCSKCQK